MEVTVTSSGSVTSSMPLTVNPNRGPSSRSSSTDPAPRWPNRKFSPTTTFEACNRSTMTSWTNSSAVTWESATVNGSTRNASIPSSATSSARRRSVVSCAGWLPGRTTSAGCGSNVISTVGRPCDRPVATASRISA